MYVCMMYVHGIRTGALLPLLSRYVPMTSSDITRHTSSAPLGRAAGTMHSRDTGSLHDRETIGRAGQDRAGRGVFKHDGCAASSNLQALVPDFVAVVQLQ